MNKFLLLSTTALACLGAANAGRADVSLPSVFSDNMVLQRDQPIRIWGTAAPRESVTVTLGTTEVKTNADGKGEWKVTLPPQPTAPAIEFKVSGKNVVIMQNVAVGDVWLCAGGGNMNRQMERVNVGKKELDAINLPNVRLLLVSKKPSATAVRDIPDKWAMCDPTSVRPFSAVAFSFARDVQAKLAVPIGVIDASLAGTPIEAWLPSETLAAIPEGKTALAEWKKNAASYPALRTAYEQKTLPEWYATVDRSRVDGSIPPLSPKEPTDYSANSERRPGNAYNALISPVLPLSFKGVLWYHGEFDVRRASVYSKLFPAMIKDWRTKSGQGDFPFIYLQLPNFSEQQQLPVEEGTWPALREAQAAALDLPNTIMTVGLSVNPNNPDDIVGNNNLVMLGKRLASRGIALATAPAADLAEVRLEKAVPEGAKVRLSFLNSGGGMGVYGRTLWGLAIRDKNGEWKSAQPTIEKDGTVLLSHPDITTPSAVAYNWASNPGGTLIGKNGRPVVPFRVNVAAAP